MVLNRADFNILPQKVTFFKLSIILFHNINLCRQFDLNQVNNITLIESIKVLQFLTD